MDLISKWKIPFFLLNKVLFWLFPPSKKKSNLFFAVYESNLGSFRKIGKIQRKCKAENKNYLLSHHPEITTLTVLVHIAIEVLTVFHRDWILQYLFLTLYWNESTLLGTLMSVSNRSFEATQDLYHFWNTCGRKAVTISNINYIPAPV